MIQRRIWRFTCISEVVTGSLGSQDGVDAEDNVSVDFLVTAVALKFVCGLSIASKATQSL
jgi:hypothetical protein